MSSSETDPSFDVVIVGAGAAGIGCGVVIKELGLERFTILDRLQVGVSFSRWPEEMSFITPSFPSHGFGLLDLNAVTLTDLACDRLSPLARQRQAVCSVPANCHRPL